MRFSLPSSISRSNFGIGYFDLLWLIISPCISFWLRDDDLFDISYPAHISISVYEYIILTVICGFLVFIFFRINNGVAHLFTSRDALSIFSAVLVSVLLSSYIMFSISRLDGIPRSIPFLYGIILFLGLVSYRLIVRGLYERKLKFHDKKSALHHLITEKKIIIVGLNQFSINAIKLTESQNPRTIQVVAAIALDGRYSGKTISGVKIIGKSLDFGLAIDEYNIHGVAIDEVWISTDVNKSYEEIIDHIGSACRDRDISFKSISEALNLMPVSMSSDSMELHTNDETLKVNRNIYIPLKRILDIIFSLILSLFMFPIFILLCIFTLYEIGSPILFWQERLGLRGRKFLLYKLRTLKLPYNDCGQALSDAERISKLGLLIRRTRLDEIPQFLSILVGEMSGIGPRPLLPQDQPQGSRERLALRPGLTGWAQVNGGELLNVEEKNALDCWYINHVSLALDVKIVYRTLHVLVYGVRRNDIEINRAIYWYKNHIKKTARGA